MSALDFLIWIASVSLGMIAFAFASIVVAAVFSVINDRYSKERR